MLFEPMPLTWTHTFGFEEVSYRNGWWPAPARACTSGAMPWGPIVLA
ncbi:hypothetical protein [Kitasatospora sp. NPDC001175]